MEHDPVFGPLESKESKPAPPARRLAKSVRISLSAFLLFQTVRPAKGIDVDVQTPQPGDSALRILSPNLLELFLVNTKQPDPARVNGWDWVDDQQVFSAPDTSKLKVLVAGQPVAVTGIGFKRRPRYAPLLFWDLRIDNQLYLKLSGSVAFGATVQVVNDGSLWPTNLTFRAVADPLRFNPTLHVNQEGYLPDYPKIAAVGYYLGDMGEMAIPTNKFQ